VIFIDLESSDASYNQFNLSKLKMFAKVFISLTLLALTANTLPVHSEAITTAAA
jgi:hypothetical protein